ncbi:MAG: DNA polymerase IV, partial [Promethearchaeota archaeon]
MSRIIMCIDMDSFYASVEVRDKPDLKDKPVAVGAGNIDLKPEGVRIGDYKEVSGAITTCNYIARKYGVKSGMRLHTVRKLCPDCIIVPPRMHRYKEVSDQIMELLGSFVDHENLEVRSIDEAFLEISEKVENFDEARQFGFNIKNEINEQIGLTCSVGIAPTKSVAKIASDINKPDGLTVIISEKVDEFLKDLPVNKIPGIGKKTAERLKKELGIDTIGHLASIKNLEKLTRLFGKNAIYFYNVAKGIDSSPVKPRSGIKSISNQRTFPLAIDDEKTIKETLSNLAERIHKRLIKGNLEFKTVTINIPFDVKTFHSKSISLKQFSNSLETLIKT